MKRTLQILTIASVTSLTLGAAFAQDNSNTKPNRPNDAGQENSREQRAGRLNGAAKASEVIGMTVKNYQDEKLGSVKDLAVDLESGRIAQVILSTGGLLGIGDKETAVPPSVLHHDAEDKVLHLDANKQKLEGAPKFESAKWAEYSDSNHLAAVYGYYGEEDAFTFIHKGDEVLDGLRDPDGEVINVDQVDRNQPPESVSNRNSKQSTRSSRQWDRNQSMIPMERLGQIQKASDIMGMSVQNSQEEELGDVDNILFDLPSGRIVAVVVSSGGFLGIGDELSAVPPSAFRFSSDRKVIQLDASKEELSKAPHFKANQWPDMTDPAYATGIYRSYGVEPYFTTNEVAKADNARRNVRDRDDGSVTPLEQGNSKADTTTTAQIRKGITAAENISLNAKNIKIITREGRVTLRGPVKSAEEKRLIENIANRVAGSENVDNQLEVKDASGDND